MIENLGLEEAQREATTIREIALANESLMGAVFNNPQGESLEKASQYLQKLQTENPELANKIIETTNIWTQIRDTLGKATAEELFQYVQQAQQKPESNSILAQIGAPNSKDVGAMVKEFLNKSNSPKLRTLTEQHPGFADRLAEGVRRLLEFQNTSAK